jgi:hypothetical protein
MVAKINLNFNQFRVRQQFLAPAVRGKGPVVYQAQSNAPGYGLPPLRGYCPPAVVTFTHAYGRGGDCIDPQPATAQALLRAVLRARC